MTNVAQNDESSNMRQFWLRVLLALGILWGGMPLLTLPLLFLGVVSAPFGLFATVLNGLTVAPACVLAFWHRRSACIWLSANAATLVIVGVTFLRRTHEVYLDGLIEWAGSVLVALCLDYMELLRWPRALDP
jgi:hypothetical protein